MTDRLIDKIKSGDYKNVVILSGAGVSTNAGIPDYRSKDGIFAQLVKSGDYPGVTQPSDFFSRKFMTAHPEISEHKLVRQFRQQMADAEPTASHQLAKWCHDRGILNRVYTQNVDGQYQKTGLSEEMIVEYHGNYLEGTIVMYGDAIDPICECQIIHDFTVDPPDLLIVMGSSLQVAPFCAIPNLVDKSCTRVLVDIAPENAFVNAWTKTCTRLFEDMYTGGGGSKSWVKFGKQRVTLRPQWQNHKRYPNQYIIRMDCDEFAEKLLGN